MAENKITDIIDASLEKIKKVVDADTIIGTPYTAPNGTTVIPVSKVMVGFASGGIDYLGKLAKSGDSPKSGANNFGGGGGTGVTVQPVGFLVINQKGDVQMLNVGAPAGKDKLDTVSGLIERAPDLIAKIKTIFKKDEKKKEKEAEVKTSESEE